MKAKDVSIGQDFIWCYARYTRADIFSPKHQIPNTIAAIDEHFNVHSLYDDYEVELAEPKQFRLWVMERKPVAHWFADRTIRTYEDAIELYNIANLNGIVAFIESVPNKPCQDIS